MVFCTNCQADVDLEYADAGALSCCPQCGRVFDDVGFSNDLTFARGADGEGEMVGQFVSETGQVRGLSRMGNGNRLWGARTDSFEVALNKGRVEVQQMVDHFHIRPRDDTMEAAQRLYHLAVQRGFTKGRRVAQVAAACLYVVCRLDGQPFMLIDFSDMLQVNVYTLGATYLELIKLLRLEEHPTFTKPIDPSLYIHRFADRLKLGNKMHPVANTTLRLIGSMKRDWMQTGRRPSGVCGAALFIAAHIHGVERSKQDIMAVVHIGWNTLDKRVREFTSTSASSLTIDEFEEQAKQHEEQVSRLLDEKAKESETDATGRDTYCEHIPHGEPHFAHGMCRNCFVDYLTVSGGTFDGQHDPPAYQTNLKREGKTQQPLALPAPGDDGEEVSERALVLASGEEEEEEVAELEEALADTELAPLTKAMQGKGLEQASSSQRRARTVASLRAAKAGMGGPSDAGPSGRGDGGSSAGGKAAPSAAGDAAAAGTSAAAAAAGDGSEAGPEQGGRKSKRGKMSLLPERTQPTEQPVADAEATAADAAAAPAAEEPARPAKRVRFAEQVEVMPDAADAGGDAEAEGDAAEGGDRRAAGDAAAGAAGQEAAAGGAEGDAAGGGELVLYDPSAADEALEDAAAEEPLSDLDSDDVDLYVATKDEAKVKEAVWLQMNRDWVEKQKAKEAALAQVAQGEAGRTHKKPGPKKGARKKAEPLNADTAQQAVGNLMEAKKLSDKINYNVLENLFNDEGPSAGGTGSGGGSGGGSGADGSGGGRASGGGGSGGGAAREASPGVGGASGGGGSGSKRRASWGGGSDEDGGDGEEDGEGGGGGRVTAELQRRSSQKALETAAANSKYNRVLEEEMGRKGGRSGLGGGFLDSLSFNKDKAGGRSRPAGLLARPRK